MSNHSLKIAEINEILTNLYYTLHKTQHNGFINSLLLAVICASALCLKITLDAFAKHILKCFAISYSSISASKNKQLVVMIVAEYLVDFVIKGM